MALEQALPAQLDANPDFTLEEHQQLFEETYGMSVSTSSISRAFKRLGVPLKKKTLFASERDEEERSAWREQVGGIDPQLLVFVDECGTHEPIPP